MISVLSHSNWNNSLRENRDTREQQANQVHGVLPSNCTFVPQVLPEFLKLREHVAVIRLIDLFSQETITHGQKFLGERGCLLDYWRIEALQNVGIGSKRESEKFLQFPVALLCFLALK